MKYKNTYKPGTRINLKHLNNDDEYAGLVRISNFIYSRVLPLVAIFFMIDLALRVNGF